MAYRGDPYTPRCTTPTRGLRPEVNNLYHIAGVTAPNDSTTQPTQNIQDRAETRLQIRDTFPHIILKSPDLFKIQPVHYTVPII